MAFCRRIPLKERKNVSRCERPPKIRDDESETITSIDSFIFPSPPDGADSNDRDHFRDERYITLDHASVVPPPFDRSLIAKHEDDEPDGAMPKISPYRKKTPVKRSTAKSPRRKRMRCINVPRVGISFDTEKTSRLKTEFMERLQNEKKARLGKNYQPGGAEAAKAAPKPERQVPSTAQRARAREKNSQFFLLHSSTIDGRKTAEKNQDVVANDSKDVISCNSFVTSNPTAAASMSAQLWTVICNSKSVSMRQLPISKARSSSKGIFYRGRRAKYNSSPKDELESPGTLNKRYKDSPEIVNAVNDWILNYDSRCDESTDTLDIAPDPQGLTHSAAAYYSSLRLPSERQQEMRNSHPAYSYGIGNHRSYLTGDTRGGGGVPSGRELKQLLAARESHHYGRSGVVGAPERHSPSTKHGNQRKRASHGYSKSGRRRSSNSMGSGKTGELRSKATYGKGAESERSNNRCESVESSTCDDDAAKITKTLEPHDSRQEVLVVCRPFLHKEVTVACEEAAMGEVVCASTDTTLNNNNQNEEKSPNDVSATSTASASPRSRFGDSHSKDAAARKHSVQHSGGQRSFTRQASAHSAHDGSSTPVSRVRDNSQTQAKISRCQLRRQVSEPKTRANIRDVGHSIEAILPSVSEMTKSSSASPVNFDLPHPATYGAKQPSYVPNDDPASPPEVKKTRIKKLVRTLPRQAPRPRHKNIMKAHSVTSVRNKVSPSAPKNESSPNAQESRKSLFSVSSAGIVPRPEDEKLGSPYKSDQPDLSAPSTANTTPTRTSDHQVNETFTISPKLNHRSRKKRIHLKRLKGDLPVISKRPVGSVSESSSRPTGDESLTPEKLAAGVRHTDSEIKDYEPRSTTSCNTSNIFSVIHEMVGNRKIQKIVPPPILTTVAAEPWPTSPKIKQEKEKKVPTPPAPVVKKRKPLKLYKRYRIPPKKSSSVATSKPSKDNAGERKVSSSSRMSHRHRRSLNPAKKLTRASALELKCPVRIEQLSHRPARSQNGNKIVSQPAKKNAKATSAANSPAAFSDKGVQVKRYSSEESKTETPPVDLFGSGLLNSEQIKSTVHKRLYSVRTNSTESIRSEAVPKHHQDFQRFIAMTRHAQSDSSFEKISNQIIPQRHGEVLDKKGSSVDAPDRYLHRRVSNNELDISGAQKTDFINTLLSNGEADPYDAGGAVGKREQRHRHGVRTSLKIPQENLVEGKENVYLKMLFSGDKIASAPNQASTPSENKSDLSSSVDPLIYESPRDQRRLSSPRTSVPYEREELKLSIPDAFLPYIRRAREYYVISQTLLHPQYKHVMRDRVPKSKEGSAPTSVSNFSEGKSISTADGSRRGSGSKEIIDLDALWPQTKVRKNLSKDSSPKKKHRTTAQEKTTKQLTANSRSSPAVDRQASSSPKVKAKVKPPASLPKVSSEKTVYKPSISRLAAPRQVSKPNLPLRPKKRAAETAVSGAMMKNRTETSAKRFVSKEQPVRTANPNETHLLPKLEKFASPGSEKRTPPKKSRVTKVSPASGGKKEGSSKQLPPLKAKVTAPKESSVSTNGSEQTVTTSSSDDKYKEPPSEAALRQTLAYLNYVKTGTRLKFPENEIQMIKYLSTSEPTLLPLGTPSALRQTRKTMAHNRRSTAPLWGERGNPPKLRKLESGSKGATHWKSSTPTNQKVKSQASSSKQKKRRIKKLGKSKLLTNSTNNKYMKSESSSSQRSKLRSKPRLTSNASPSYGSGIWQQPSNLRENLLLLSALNRCRNNSDRASDGIKDFATLYDLRSELSGRNVYIPKVLQNMLAEREKSQKSSRLPGKRKKPRGVPCKFGNAKRHRKVSCVHPKRAPRKLATKSGISLQQVSLATRKPVTSQTITNMIKKTFTGKDMIGKSIQGLVSDLKSISETLKASPARLFGDGRPVFARRPVGPLDEKVLERNSTRVDSSDSTLNSSQNSGGDSELTSEESDTVMKDGVSETKVDDNPKNSILDTGGIVQGGRKIWSAAYDRVVKMLSGDKVPAEPKYKPKPKKSKKRDPAPAAGKKMSISEKVPKRVLPKPPSTPFEPEYLHVAGDALQSKVNLAADPKSCALLKLGTELSCADGVPPGKAPEKNTRSNSNKRRVVKTSKGKKSPKIPVSRVHM